MKPRQSKLIRTAAALYLFSRDHRCGALWYLEEQGNFHPITPGEAYRSAQLDPDELEYDIRKFKIRSIINLKGKDVGEPLYEAGDRILP